MRLNWHYFRWWLRTRKSEARSILAAVVVVGLGLGMGMAELERRATSGQLKASTSAGASPANGRQILSSTHKIYVVDGDTLRLPSGERVRLVGIDTAEMPPRAACDREVQLALAAKARLQQLVRGAEEVSLRRPAGERDRDRYDRLLRDVFVDGHDAGDILVSEGLAQVWRGRKARWC